MAADFRFAGTCLLLLTGLVLGCGEERPSVPRPHAYPRVEYPERNMVVFSSEDCPFTFTYPDYFSLETVGSFFGETPAHPCWFDLQAPGFDASIHCSYYEVGNTKPYDELVKDAFTIANRINQRSNFMDEVRVANPRGVSGVALEFTGPAASPMHFYLSDTTTHFFRGSLYFNSRIVPDSLAPIAEFIKVDIADIINSFEWQ